MRDVYLSDAGMSPRLRSQYQDSARQASLLRGRAHDHDHVSQWQQCWGAPRGRCAQVGADSPKSVRGIQRMMRTVLAYAEISLLRAPTPHARRSPTTPGWLVGIGFAALAAVLGSMSLRAEVPVSASAAVADDQVKPGARRAAESDPPMYTAGGFDHRCNACHRLFRSRPAASTQPVQHTEIVLNHGLNNRCYNCHDRKDREKVVLMRGTLGGFDQATELCAKCHGPVYRDWQAGTHGKTLGSWMKAGQRRLICTECHDPHAPAYPSFQPLPGPGTLRMGDQSPTAHPHGDDSPLRLRTPHEDHHDE
jgi:hypothetical protein